MATSDSDLLILENLTYIDESFAELTGLDLDLSSYNSVGDMVDNVFTEDVLARLDAMGDGLIDGGMNSAGEWAAMIRYIQGNDDLRNLRVVDAPRNSNGKTFALCFEDLDDPGKAVVAFRGTLDGDEWVDNAYGFSQADTRAQREALDYIESLAYLDITVTGHSKGGNKAQYVAILSDKVTRAVSFDGQGFSVEFITKYAAEILANAGKLDCYSLDTDFVHILMYYLPGVEQHFVLHGDDVADLPQNHSPDALFDFVVDENGQYHLRINDDGRAAMPEGIEDPSMTLLHGFTTFILNTAPDSDKGMITAYIAELLKAGFGGSFDKDNVINLALSDEDALASVMAYLIKYMDVYDLSTDEVNQILNSLGFNNLNDLIDKRILGIQVDVEAILRYMLGQLKDTDDDSITRAIVKAWLQYLSGFDIDLDVDSLWAKIQEHYQAIGDVDPLTARSDMTALAGRIWNFSAHVYDSLTSINSYIANTALPDVSSWTRYSGEGWYRAVLTGVAVKGISAFTSHLQSMCTTSSTRIDTVFENCGAAYAKMANQIGSLNDSLSAKLAGFQALSTSVG